MYNCVEKLSSEKCKLISEIEDCSADASNPQSAGLIYRHTQAKKITIKCTNRIVASVLRWKNLR